MTEKADEVLLIGCGSKKASTPTAARFLYTGNLFVLAREYAEKSGRRWFILSAKYGLVEPDDVLEPYSLSLSDLNPHRREIWGSNVRRLLRMRGIWECQIIFLAGKEYARGVRGAPNVLFPLKRLRLGERIHWFQVQKNSFSRAP